MTWWRSPAFILPAALVGGTTIGIGVARAAARVGRCKGVTDEGGVVAGVRYLERMRGGASPTERMPMVLVLHSLGGTPEGYAGGMGGIGRARLILPEGEFDRDNGKSWFGKGLHAVVDGGNKPEDLAIWKSAGDRLARFIDAITHCRPTIGKPIATGSSQGGEASLLLANDHRRKIHGAVSINGDMPGPLWHRRMAPTVMVNGTGDTTVPFDWAEEHAQEMIDRGAPLTFVSMDSSGHAITSEQSKAWIAAVRAMVSEIGGD